MPTGVFSYNSLHSLASKNVLLWRLLCFGPIYKGDAWNWPLYWFSIWGEGPVDLCVPLFPSTVDMLLGRNQLSVAFALQHGAPGLFFLWDWAAHCPYHSEAQQEICAFNTIIPLFCPNVKQTVTRLNWILTEQSVLISLDKSISSKSADSEGIKNCAFKMSLDTCENICDMC